MDAGEVLRRLVSPRLEVWVFPVCVFSSEWLPDLKEFGASAFPKAQ